MEAVRKCWLFVKLVYLYIAYWLVGLSEEYFQIMKGHYLLDLGWPRRAIRNFKKALKNSDDPRIYEMIDYCYSQLGNQNGGIECYRKAFEEKGDPRIGFGLAKAEFNRGNIEKSIDIIRGIQDSTHTVDTFELDMLKAQIELVKKEREDVKHMDDEFKKLRR